MIKIFLMLVNILALTACTTGFQAKESMASTEIRQANRSVSSMAQVFSCSGYYGTGKFFVGLNFDIVLEGGKSGGGFSSETLILKGSKAKKNSLIDRDIEIDLIELRQNVERDRPHQLKKEYRHSFEPTIDPISRAKVDGLYSFEHREPRDGEGVFSIVGNCLQE